MSGDGAKTRRRRCAWLIFSELDRALADAFKRHLVPWGDRLDVEDHADHPAEDIADVVRALPPDADIVWIVTAASLADEDVAVEVDAASSRKITPIIAGASLWETAEILSAHRPNA